MAREVVMILGFPSSGKSTETEKYLQRGFDRLNRDLLGGTIEGLVPRLDGLLNSGSKGVVLDNLFPTIAVRKPFLEVAKRHKVPVTAVVMDTSIEDAGFNATLRMVKKYGKLLSNEEMTALKDPNMFPPVVVFSYRKDFERPTVPEGFTNILTGRFVRNWGTTGYTNKALLLDKDGTLTTCKSGGKFPCSADDVEVLPGRSAILKEYQAAGYRLLGVTNQSGISKGDLSEEALKSILAVTNEKLGVDIEWAYCPHRVPPITCWCRKPQTGFGALFIERHKLLPGLCLMVGDAKTDETFSKRCGFRFADHDEFFAGKVKP